MDPEGEVGLRYGAFDLPVTYLIDRKGTLLARLWGPLGQPGRKEPHQDAIGTKVTGSNPAVMVLR